ncbi:MAG: hypothetical protein R6T98_04655 [Desulfatiglandales bacterium]
MVTFNDAGARDKRAGFAHISRHVLKDSGVVVKEKILAPAYLTIL